EDPPTRAVSDWCAGLSERPADLDHHITAQLFVPQHVRLHADYRPAGISECVVAADVLGQLCARAVPVAVVLNDHTPLLPAQINAPDHPPVRTPDPDL